MNEERKKILEMLSQGKISVEEAEKLLAAVSVRETESPAPPTSGTGFKYLRVVVEPGPESQSKDKVNVRVPLKLIRAGLKWAAFIPKEAHLRINEALHEKGMDMDFSKIKPEDLEELVNNLNDLTVEVEGKERVRVFCE